MFFENISCLRLSKHNVVLALPCAVADAVRRAPTLHANAMIGTLLFVAASGGCRHTSQTLGPVPLVTNALKLVVVHNASAAVRAVYFKAIDRTLEPCRHIVLVALTPGPFSVNHALVVAGAGIVRAQLVFRR